MTEPTLEEMKKAVMTKDPSSRCELFRGKYRIAWMPLTKRDTSCGPSFGNEDDAWRDAYAKLTQQPAPESEDEAFERAWMDFITYPRDLETEHQSEIFREGWNARARLSAGGK